MTPAEIRKIKNVAAQGERKVFRRILRQMKEVQSILDEAMKLLDKHVVAVSKRKGGLGRK